MDTVQRDTPAQRIARASVLLAIIFFVLGFNAVWYFKISDVAVIVACVATLSFWNGQKADRSRFFSRYRSWIMLAVSAACFMFVGFAVGTHFYAPAAANDFPSLLKIVGGGFFRFLISAALFFLTAYYGADLRWRRRAIAAFLSPLIFIPSLLFPDIAVKTRMVNDIFVFQGLTMNPSSAASLLLFSLAALLYFFLRSQSAAGKTASWILSMGVMALIVWTGSRGAWLALLIMAITATAYLPLIVPKMRRASFIFGIVAALTVAFLVLPPPAKIMALDRLYPAVTNHFPSIQNLAATPLARAFRAIKANPVPSFPYQARETLWPMSFGLVLQNPFGYGPRYEHFIFSIRQGGAPTSSHNTFLETLLVGGMGLFVVFCIVLWKLGRTLFAISKKDAEWLALLTMALAGFVLAMVNDHFSAAPWLWALGGLIASKEELAATDPSRSE